MNEMIFSGINLNQLLEKIGQLIDSKLSKIASHTVKPDQCKFISRREVARLLMISLPTLNDYTKLGWLQSYKLGKRVLYKQEEVLACIDRVATHKYKKGGIYGA